MLIRFRLSQVHLPAQDGEGMNMHHGVVFAAPLVSLFGTYGFQFHSLSRLIAGTELMKNKGVWPKTKIRKKLGTMKINGAL